MSTCQVCGNAYQNPLVIQQNGNQYTFDCFECAIQELAPECKHCSCKIIGHGIEANGEFYCCAHCARESGLTGARDRV
ncbi:hypothetical protein [Legionella sp. 16cNR16C]|uniref:hypothetical protein n=1 Tax=Legionella sp. 16cNR16C TaxID=2905656 RepID=UPI001E587F8D|nr:hypothetical protein [Legionella sp. 16cNR16C]MCE3043583.1 hypothetical protein [Legionella sp. 16cNR16C]